jgi:hypothetical protein
LHFFLASEKKRPSLYSTECLVAKGGVGAVSGVLHSMLDILSSDMYDTEKQSLPWNPRGLPRARVRINSKKSRESEPVALHEDLLPPGTAHVASLLAQWPVMHEFYLAGGTALALHLGHRQSQDLDFFTRKTLKALPTLAGLDDLLTDFRTVEWELKTTEHIQWRLNEVSVTLLAYPFPHHFAYYPWQGIAVADARDVAVQIPYTVGRRAQARDYLDLHAVLTRGLLSLDDLIRLAQETYQDAFSTRLFLQQLTYTQDLPDRDNALSLLVTPQSFDTITHDLTQQVQTWVAQQLRPSTRSPQGPRL